MFCEVCIYEARIGRQDEIEALMEEVAEFYRSQPGVIDVSHTQNGRTAGCLPAASPR